MIRWVCRLASALLACVLVVLLGSAALAVTPAPVPSLLPGQSVTVTGWTCEPVTVTNPDASVTTSESCGATSYAVQEAAAVPVPVALPAVQDVRVVAPNPLPVSGVSSGDGSGCPRPESSPAPESSPSPESSPAPESSAAPCMVALVPEQWSRVELALGALVFFASAGSVMAWRSRA